MDKGFTVFTGPNGSGKSNIVDAVRFVLGDLSARSLRASKMSEVIFDGVPGTPASKTAYVKICFDNRDRKIPVDTDIVTLSRSINRGGLSKYTLNGRIVPRSQLVDTLGMARLHSSGYNMIMQGTITKLAEITPEERRKVIEGFVGIAEYDAKKAEARVQLNQAETNLRIADARIGDVQSRLESLEEERNDALRHNFIQGEIRKLQAVLASHRISEIENERERLAEQLQQKLSKVESIKEQQGHLQLKRSGIESERRKFDEEVADKGSVRLVQIQKTVGDITANIVGLRTEVESGKTSLKGLTKIREERAKQLEALSNEIQESSRYLVELRAERDKSKQDLEERLARRNNLSKELTDLKQGLGTNTVKIDEIEMELGKLERQALRLDAQLKMNIVKQRMVSDNLKSLEERRSSFELTLKELEAHLNELQRLQKEEQESLANVSSSLEKASARKNELLLEMEDAEKTARIARSAIVEFETQKDFAEKIVTEESALQRIEEMGDAGAILGIFGRLQNLTKVNLKYKKALEVAAAGWLNAVVVEDLMTALKCVESLKKMKIGRIKLIPLREVKDVEVKEPPNIDGVIGLASEFIQCDKKYVGAVNFIFGDTVVTSGERSAFLVSKAGFRAVDLNGDLYEAGGGIESGYYRSPVDISSLIPSDIAVEGLTKSVQSLERMLSKRKDDIDNINQEFTELNGEQVKRLDIVNVIARDLEGVSKSVDRTKQNIKTLHKRVERLNRYVEKGKNAQTQLRSQRAAYLKSMFGLKSQKKKLKLVVDQLTISKYEADQARINSEIGELSRVFLKDESDVKLLEANLETTLKPEYERVRLDIQTLTEQIKRINESIIRAQSSLDGAMKQLSELEKSKESLSDALTSVKGKRKEFEERLDGVDLQLKRLNQEYDPLSDNLHQLDLELQRKNLEYGVLKEELRRLGCEKPIPVDAKEVKNIDSSLDLMRFELEQLGSVNQLAPVQYDEQQKNYKHLSVRRNQLEEERRAILEFIEEIERKKREAFMEAYDKVSESFSVFFEKLTGGGKGWLSLEKPEDPFSVGLDIFVQFPGKASRLIAGASGGEKSVVAVAFIFAIQGLSPAFFYIFDEIDAHLDPYNAERLADLLKEQSFNSQFIVITLRDVVIDRSEKLFGIYVQNGVSQIVSTRIAEAMV